MGRQPAQSVSVPPALSIQSQMIFSLLDAVESTAELL